MISPVWMRVSKEEVILNLYIQPNASKCEIVGLHDDRLKIKIDAPAQDNKANKKLIEYLSGILSINKNDLKLEGEKSRYKTVSANIKYIDIIKEKLG